MPDVHLGSPLPLPALLFALLGAALVVAVQRYRRGRNPRRYDPRLAWMRAGAYFSFAWALGLLTGALSTIADNPLVFPGQTSDVWWWVLTVVSLAVVLVGYWVIWPIGTRAHGRHLVMPDTPLFGVLWGVSEGLVFASVWTTAVRVFGRSDVAERLAVFAVCYLVLSLFIGLWHAVYWDIYIAPEHNVLEWNIRKVILCHNPNVIVTTAYVTLFGNLGVYVGLQAVALFGATIAMPFPSFRLPNPETDPDAPPRRDLHGMVCVLTGIGSPTVADVAVDLADVGATVVLAGADDAAARALLERARRWSGSDTVELVPADLSSAEGATRLADLVRQRWGGADVLVDDPGPDGGAEGAEGAAGADRADRVDGAARLRAGVALQRALAALATPERPLRIEVVGAEEHRGVEASTLQALVGAGGGTAAGTAPDAATLSAVRVAAARELAERLDPATAQVHVLASGVMVGNAAAEAGGAASFFSTIFQSNEDPARTYVHLARTATLDPATGGYWTNSAPTDPSPVLDDAALAEALWEWSTREG